jgi:transposase
MLQISEWKIEGNMLAEKRDNHWTYNPQPFPEESFLSWFTRLAKENCSDAYLLYQALREGLPSSCASNEETCPQLRRVETNGADRAKLIEALAPVISISLADMQSIKLMPVPPKNYWDFLNTPLANPRYCPSCLESDATPYFRAYWYAKWYLVCPIHHSLLRETCHQCGHPVEFWKTSWYESITSCPCCHQDLSNSVDGTFFVHDLELPQKLLQVYEKGILGETHVDPTNFFRQLWKIISQISKHFVINENLGRGKSIPAELILHAIVDGLQCVAIDPERLKFPFGCAACDQKFASSAALKHHELEHETNFPPAKKSRKRSQTPFRHLKPHEVIAIKAAIEEGVRVTDLSKKFNVSRATIYNANTSTLETFNDTLTKRKRKPRISRLIKEKILAKKNEFPRWSAPQIRNALLQEGLSHVSITTIYKVLRESRNCVINPNEC